MNNRDRVMAVLNYESFDRLPAVHFGYWEETLIKWANEGHFDAELLNNSGDGTKNQKIISDMLGFDSIYSYGLGGNNALLPGFKTELVGTTKEGFEMIRNGHGVTELYRNNAVSIHAEVDHLLKDRASWEEHFKPRLQPSKDRINPVHWANFYNNIYEYDAPLTVSCGSLYGKIRDFMGVEGISYLYADDEELYFEIIDTMGTLCFEQVKMCMELAKELNIKFDMGGFWEDICFKNGPLVIPSIFYEFVGPHYKRITSLLNENGINVIHLDCDGCIDALVPTWFENGVNTMFPMEVGTWNAEITPWRNKFGRDLRGIGGMNKTVFSEDYSAVDREIERLKPLIALGGYLPIPDHRIAPDAIWENVQYYCEKLKAIKI